MKPFLKFDVTEVPLKGKNLVEASAGTGKTFSIAVLVLRLILEKNIPIEKILLVTFTKNAVAELEERIRIFVRDAHNYAEGGKEKEKIISKVVDKAVDVEGMPEIRQRLNDALLFLDQLSVTTIHGFCGQTLNNLAFETGQLFGSQVQASMDEIYELYVTGFWRSHINTLPSASFRLLRDNQFSASTLKKLIANYYDGKTFYRFDKTRHYELAHIEIEEAYLQLEREEKEILESFEKYLSENLDAIRSAMQQNSHAKKYLDQLRSADSMWNYVITGYKKGTKYFNGVFGDTLIPFILQVEENEEKKQGLYQEIFDNVCCFALQEIPPQISAHIERAGIISYNGLIKNLHQAITGENSRLIVKELQLQYQAVFVDEFQDTDKWQYEIFKTAFHTHTILFYIGDPKQSIYAFRQADINTYLSSYDDVDYMYSMNTNFRSSPELLAALNRFFLPTDDFDTFYFPNQKASIKYVNVDANPRFPADRNLYYKGEKHTPVIIESCNKNEDILHALTSKILRLLTNKDYTIGNGSNARRIRPSDMAILVSGNQFGKIIKQKLNERNIPAIVFNDEKIMQSDEASALYYVSKAMLDPVIENINTGILNPITGKRSFEIGKLKKEQLIGLFRNYKSIWETSGINLAISTFMKDFGINEYLTNPETVNGLRMITNLNQLRELLNKTEYFQRLNPAELLDWLKRAKDLELLDEDEGVIRLENDAESVTIMTIHKSKGLQFNIVFSPQSDLTVRDADKNDWVDIWDQGNYISIPGNRLNEEQEKVYEMQSKQEKRRLLYVALTRAVYSCFIYTNKQHEKESSVIPFIEKVENNELIRKVEFSEDERLSNETRYEAEGFRHAQPTRLKNGFELLQPYWRFMSYSALAAKPEHGIITLDTQVYDNEYDTFVFETLRKGSITGTMLHEIFESVDFQNVENYHYVIAAKTARYAASQSEVYLQFLPSLVEHVLGAGIITPEVTFKLNDIARRQRLHELEFDFPIGKLNSVSLMDVCKGAGIDVSITERNELYGMMNGFIDMLFEFNGKYFVLDWKSNFIGNTIEQYTGDHLDEAMTQINYHLQYLIYTLAVSKYLAIRLPDFDYEKHFGGVIYCFVRGMRKNKNSGVFFYRPSKSLVESLKRVIE